MKKSFFIMFCLIFVNIFCSAQLVSIPNCDSIDSSIAYLEDCAKKSDYFVQYNLGVMYRDGIRVKKDLDKAIYWFKLSAEQGFDNAEVNLGQLYEINNNPELAFSWTYKSATKNNLMAINNLAKYCLIGFGTPKSIERSFALYSLAAENGLAEAQLNLSSLYISGSLGYKDINKAIFWAEQSANQDYILAMGQVSLLYRENKDYSNALRWAEKAVLKNDAVAEANLAYLYSLGLGVEKNKKEAELWIKRVSEKNDANANLIIGAIYESQDSILGYDIDKALLFYMKSADANNGLAQNNIGRILFNVKKDNQNAISWFIKSTDNNVPEAMYALYQIYSNGAKDVPKDPEKAKYWLDKARENGLDL